MERPFGGNSGGSLIFGRRYFRVRAVNSFFALRFAREAVAGEASNGDSTLQRLKINFQ